MNLPEIALGSRYFFRDESGTSYFVEYKDDDGDQIRRYRPIHTRLSRHERGIIAARAIEDWNEFKESLKDIDLHKLTDRLQHADQAIAAWRDWKKHGPSVEQNNSESRGTTE